MDILSAVWAAVPLLLLVLAAVSDVRTREVKDWCWYAIIAWGLVFGTMVRWDGSDHAALLVSLLDLVLVAVWVLSPRITGLWGLPMAIAVLVLSGISLHLDTETGLPGAMAFVLVLLFYVMYQVNLIPGGADAKCLMALALAFPVYPDIFSIWAAGIPASVILSPAFSILVIALVITVLGVIPVACRNIRDGNRSRSMFLSYRAPISEARTSFVWLLERVEDGDVVRCRPLVDEKEKELDLLEASGRNDVLVTPMVPFILPLAIASAIVLLFGSPLFI